jgi:hypothetical protein
VFHQAVKPVFTAYGHGGHTNDPEHDSDEEDGEYEVCHTGHGGLHCFQPADLSAKPLPAGNEFFVPGIQVLYASVCRRSPS